MNEYERMIRKELQAWEKKIYRRNTLASRYVKSFQTKVNEKIPAKIHQVITSSMKQMVKAVLLGSEYTTKQAPLINASLEEREELVREKLQAYKRTASIEGAGTGAGGLLLGAVDFPLLLTIKMKLLFDVASGYGFNVKEYSERLYILHLFQLAYSSDKKRIEIYEKIKKWEETKALLLHEEIDWYSWQQDYRDHIDFVKLFQLMPGIGAVIGAVANYKLLEELGQTAMNGYRIRINNRRNT